MVRTKEMREIVAVGGEGVVERVILKEIVIGLSRWNEFTAHMLEGPCSKNGPDGVLSVAPLGLRVLNLDFKKNIVSWEQ
ncbi:MAG TPA: hypothetical protein VKZ59_13320 [Acidobacteriota bacterium]|nr:hypothetical protein [Acidobacteriota bacterium]